MQDSNYPPIRRVVTGHDTGNVAKVLIDAPATNAKRPQAGLVSTMMWCTEGAPAAIPVGEKIDDMGARILGTAPPANGTRFAVIDFPPGNSGRMHRTETIDYVVVIAGEIDMILNDSDLDGSTVHLKAGDVMVQRGTNHAWVNRGSGPARLAFVLIDARPLGIGHPVTGGASPR
jgi:quercetin dioxygenase-like cupin family protein